MQPCDFHSSILHSKFSFSTFSITHPLVIFPTAQSPDIRFPHSRVCPFLVMMSDCLPIPTIIFFSVFFSFRHTPMQFFTFFAISILVPQCVHSSQRLPEQELRRRLTGFVGRVEACPSSALGPPHLNMGPGGPIFGHLSETQLRTPGGGGSFFGPLGPGGGGQGNPLILTPRLVYF